VIDEVEGTSLSGASEMEKVINNIPKSFASIEEALEWKYSID
jgi:hypothetical protein